MLRPDDSLCAHGRLHAEEEMDQDREEFFEALQVGECKAEPIDLADVDVLMLRNGSRRSTPRLRRGRRRRASCSGAKRPSAGRIVLNDPDSLGRAINKLYFQSFPAEARAETLITKR